jgi:hypothetical protein
MLGDQSWDELWGELLSANFGYSDQPLHLDTDETSGTLLCNVEGGIESWAERSLLCSNGSSSDGQPTPVETFNGPVSSSPELLCYGMVSPSHIISLTQSDNITRLSLELIFCIDLSCLRKNHGKYVRSRFKASCKCSVSCE